MKIVEIMNNMTIRARFSPEIKAPIIVIQFLEADGSFIGRSFTRLVSVNIKNIYIPLLFCDKYQEVPAEFKKELRDYSLSRRFSMRRLSSS